MVCTHCGAAVQRAARFCPSCGGELTPTQPSQPTLVGGEISEWDLVAEALRAEYDLIEELGRGGMAIVYKARERLLDRDVAVKVLPTSLAFDADFVARFQREAQTAARLEHPNIIPIYRVGQSGRVIYFVMKLLRGKSLADLVSERGALAPSDVRRILAGTAAALGYAHQHEIVHRDIKPDNIMFDDAGNPIVTDFGIAKAASSSRLTSTGMSIGTPLYMSPEQARARDLDGRSDIYALGIVTYQCLTGRVPFDGEDSYAIGFKHIMEDLPVPPLPTAEHRMLFQVIQRMTAKQPDDRFQTAEDLLDHLEQVGEGTDVWVAAPTIVLPPQPADRLNGAPAGASVEVAPTVATPAVAARGAHRARKSAWTLRGALVAALLGALGGALYWVLGSRAGWPLLTGRPALPEVTLASSAPVGAPRLKLALLDSLLPGGEDSTIAAGADTGAAAVADSVAGADDVVEPVVDSMPPPRTVTYGVLVLQGLPRTARLSLDGTSKQGVTHRVDAGSHLVEVRASGYETFTATVPVEDGDTVPVRVAMARIEPKRTVNPCTKEPPEAAYFTGGTCYDTRPSPVRPPLVHLAPGALASVAPVPLLVKISADGTPIQILRGRKQEAEPRLILGAIQFVRDSLSFVPATKAGRPIAAWARVTVQFRPAR